MKSLFIYILLPGIFYFSASKNVTAQSANSGFCNISALSDSCKHLLQTFHYSGQNAMHIALKSEPQGREITFPAFQGEKYRIIINTTDMPKGTEVDIYDQDARHKKRKQLFTTQSNGLSNFDTDSKSGRLYVEYTVPAATATCYTGCAVILIGYENLQDDGK